MSDTASDSDPLSPLAESFLARLRRGEHPALCEYTDRFPELAERIRNLFPALAAIEHFGSVAPKATGAYVHTPGPSTCLERLGEFAILREVGRGGMGVVYEAVQEPLGRHVALKVLPSSARIDPIHLERFRREAKAAAGLHHSNIVPVFGVGEAEGVHYYAMQFIRGQTLDAVLDEVRRLRAEAEPAPGPDGDLSFSIASGLLTGHFARAEAPTEAATCTTRRISTSGSLSSQTEVPYYRGVARIGLQTAEALAYAHNHGVLHRDIKPSNLLLDAQGIVWVTDFGLAKAEDQPGLTHSGDIVGTLRYMAPERFEGRSDPRSDVYGLGATLYEMVTLGPAFQAGDRLRLIEQVRLQTPPTPRSLDRRIPRDLETIVQKAMAKEPSDRYASAEALAEDLRLYLADRPILARRASTVERAWRWSRRNPLPATLMAGIAALLMTLAVGGTWAAWTFAEKAEIESRLRTDAVEARGVAASKAKEAQTKAEDLERSLYIDRVNRAYREWEANNIALAEQLLEECPRALRAWEWNFVKRQCHFDLRTNRNSQGVWAQAFSPEGSRFASGGGAFPQSASAETGEIVLREVDTGREVLSLRELRGSILGLAFSPDGRRLISGDGFWVRRPPEARLTSPSGTLIVWDTVTGQRLLEQAVPDLMVTSVASSPDGRLIAAGCGVIYDYQAVGHVRILDSDTGEERFRLPGHPGGIFSVAFSPDGQTLAVAHLDQVELWDLATRQRRHALTGHRSIVYCVAFRPDGKELASAGWDQTVRLWDPAAGTWVRTLSGHTGFVRALAYSPDGKTLISAAEDRAIKLWDPATGMEQATVRGHRAFVQAVAFGPDGRRFVTGSTDQEVKLWDIRTSHPIVFRKQGSWVDRLAFSLDGRRVASGGTGVMRGSVQSIRIWDPMTGELQLTLDTRGGFAGRIQFSPNGQRVSGTVHHMDGRNLEEIWDATTGQRLSSNPLPFVYDENKVRAMMNGGKPSARDYVLLCWDKSIELRDGKTHRLLRTLHGHRTPPIDVDFSEGQRYLVSISADMHPHTKQNLPIDEIRFWDLETGEGRLIQRDVGLKGLVLLTADGSRIGLIESAPPGQKHCDVFFWDAKTGKRLPTLRGHTEEITDGRETPDGKRFVTSSHDGTIKFWDLDTGQDVFTLRGHAAGVRLLAFSPDGHRLISGSIDWTARVWDAAPIDAPEPPARQP